MELNFKVRFSRSGEKSLQRLSRSDIGPILKKLSELHRFSSAMGNIKKLKGVAKNIFRLRIGDKRIIFEVVNDKRLIWILFVGYRSNVYRNME